MDHAVGASSRIVLGFERQYVVEAARIALLAALLTLCSLLVFVQNSYAQNQGAPNSAAQSAATPGSQDQNPDPETIFPHPDSTRWWISGQINTILQGHPGFFAEYTGAHSLNPNGEIRDSRVLTLYTGLKLAHWTELIFDAESTQGRGISDALGLAGFTNVDVVRNPDLGPKPYVARFMIRQIIPLNHQMTAEERGPFSLATEVPVRRLELRAGKLSLPDFFDVNAVGSDDHLQFMNWADVSNGAYD